MTRLPRVLLVATASVPWAALAQRPPTPPTFSMRVEAVRVDVRVTEGGSPVRGLQPSDFEITDNGVPQRVDFAGFEQIPLNVVLVLDMSDSVKGSQARSPAGRSARAGRRPRAQRPGGARDLQPSRLRAPAVVRRARVVAKGARPAGGHWGHRARGRRLHRHHARRVGRRARPADSLQ